ncbi:MAG TPA: universal stress protein [Streptosporangiaceae bacterium]|nr:universal stress protein [Streptosporangiaceae bacterium]
MPGIIVGIDGSHHSTRALEWALREAAIQHAPLTVLTVHSVPASAWTGNPILVEQDADDQEKMLKSAEELTHKAVSQMGEARPDSITVRSVSGFPAREIIDESRDADLVVVGSRGAGGFAKLMMGAVSSQVVGHAHCPVVVVPTER